MHCSSQKPGDPFLNAMQKACAYIILPVSVMILISTSHSVDNPQVCGVDHVDETPIERLVKDYDPVIRRAVKKQNHPFNIYIDKFRENKRIERCMYDDECWHEMKHKEIEKLKEETIYPKMRPARPDEYTMWLKGYVEAGGKPTHSYDFDTPINFYVAMADFSLFALYGAQAMHIIVPAHVKFLGGDPGHSILYLMDGYRNMGEFVPVYKDTYIPE